MDMAVAPPRIRRPYVGSRYVAITSYILAGMALVAVLLLHLVPTLIAGLLMYALVDLASPLLRGRIASQRARVVALAVIALIIAGSLVLLGLGITEFVQGELGSSSFAWEQQLMPIVDKARQQLPQAWVSWLPASAGELRTMAVASLRLHAGALGTAGVETLRVFVHVLIGLALGGMLSLTQARDGVVQAPLTRSLSSRCSALSNSFRDIVFAQSKISLVNTILTAIFLLVALPLFGVHVPFANALVVLTFVVGLLPVVGNLISNTAITVAALSLSPAMGVIALGYLVIIHKVEFFLNARIVGGQIRAKSWEVLISMLVMDAAFGIPGLVAGPIYYAYLKRELTSARLV